MIVAAMTRPRPCTTGSWPRPGTRTSGPAPPRGPLPTCFAGRGPAPAERKARGPTGATRTRPWARSRAGSTTIRGKINNLASRPADPDYVRGLAQVRAPAPGGSPDALRIQTSEGRRLSIGWGGHAPHWIDQAPPVPAPFLLPALAPCPSSRPCPRSWGMFSRIHKLTLTTELTSPLPTVSGRKAVEWEFKIPDWARLALVHDPPVSADEQAGPYR